MSMIVFVCLAVTVATLVYVFYLPGTLQLGAEKTQLEYLRERKEVIYENLRDLNFEFKSGKFPEADYQSMKNSLEEEAAALLSQISILEKTGRSGAPSRHIRGTTV
jgi:hypothetical protein